MSNTTRLIIRDIENPVELRRILNLLMERLDILEGNRGNDKSAKQTDLDTLETRVSALESP